MEERRDGEVYIVTSGNGNLFLDAEGKVLRQETTEECKPVAYFDLDEYKFVWEKKEVPTEIDILDIRGVLVGPIETELVWKDYKKERKRRIGEENFKKFSTSPYPLIVQMKKSHTRSGRKAKQRRKRALVEKNNESSTVSVTAEGRPEGLPDNKM